MENTTELDLCRGYRQAPSDVRYKITPHSDILAKVQLGGVLQPQRLGCKKINTNK